MKNLAGPAMNGPASFFASPPSQALCVAISQLHKRPAIAILEGSHRNNQRAIGTGGVHHRSCDEHEIVFRRLLRRRGLSIARFLHLLCERVSKSWDEFVRNFARGMPTQF